MTIDPSQSCDLDGSCFRFLVDIDAAEYAHMPIGLLRDAVEGMRRALDGPLDPLEIRRRDQFSTTYAMMEPALLAELLERLPRLPATCTAKMDVGKEFDPTSVPLVFLRPAVLDEVIRDIPKMRYLPDIAIDLIVAHAQRSLPGILIFGENDRRLVHAGIPGYLYIIARGLPHYPVRFARPVSMTADGACTIQELRHVPIGPDILEPKHLRDVCPSLRHNAFVPVDEPVDGETKVIRFHPNNHALYGPGRWSSARYGSFGDNVEVWSTWNGLPAKAQVVR